MSKHKYDLPIILYDSECTLCNRFKQAIERIPGIESYRLVSAHDDQVYKRYPFLQKEKCLQILHVIDKNEEIFTGGDAINHLITHFPGIKKFSWLAESGMGKKAIDFFYEVANKYREYRYEECSGCKKKSPFT